jgi:short-subunit dehydrogenase
MKNCIIIAGANGEIGQAFINRFIPNNKIIAISRYKASKINHPNLDSVVVDLTKPRDLEKAFLDFNPTKYKEIILIHSIGRDKFENQNYPKIDPLETIDPSVYASNVNTYKYIARLLIKKVKIARKIKPVKLRLVTIGSVADKYGLLVITSFSESKNIVRSYMRDAAALFPWISALVINISSTVTKSALEVRPFSDTTYWLTPKEVVERSWKKILRQFNHYEEIDIYKNDPKFRRDYYFDDKKVFDRWVKYVRGK